MTNMPTESLRRSRTEYIAAPPNDVTIALGRLLDRSRERYARYRAYYNGDHGVTYTSDKVRDAFAAMVREYNCNLMPAVVDAVADRLQVTGFGVEAGPANAADAAWDVWNQNRMDRKAGELHQEVLTCGDAYAVVWPDMRANRVRIWPNRADHMTVWYDEEDTDTITMAAKLWTLTDQRARLTLYYSNRIERYITRAATNAPLTAASFVEYVDANEPSFPLVNPWGVVPVFHFANNAALGAFGHSELQGAIKPQDALNTTVRAMLTAQEYHAMPQRWATGLQVPNDPITGKPQGGIFQPGGVWAVAHDGVRYGEFSAGDMDQFLRMADAHRLDIARNTGTPLHYMQLMTDPPSGEALKTLLERSTKKVKDRQTSLGNTYEDMMALVLRMAGNGTDETRLTTHWSDPAPRSEKEEAETLNIKKALGVSWRQLMVEAGYSDATIDEMIAERADVAARQPVVPSQEAVM